MDFTSKLQQTLEDDMNISVTENYALGYQTSGSNLLDLNFAVASLRRASEGEIIKAFTKAYFDDKAVALTWLFYARDIRGGLGERRLFRIIFEHLAKTVASEDSEVPIRQLIQLIPEYGRYDDLFVLLGTPYYEILMALIKEQLESDLKAMEKGESISLLAKWLPSVNASSKTTRQNARIIANILNMNQAVYRKTLSQLRNYLDIVERKMSALRFGEIKYEAVPSKANLLYNQAFLKRDEERRRAYLESLKKGETKINASVLYPHEIVHAYMPTNYSNNGYNFSYDETLEQLWKALPNIPELSNTIVVADGSGSMFCHVGAGSCSALSVANALAIYFAEHCNGEFKDKYITFSASPQLVNLSKGKNLLEKLQIAMAYNEVANTNIEAVFNLILKTAKKNRMSQKDLPKNIVIISDMEFDVGADKIDKRLFDEISAKYEQNGYKLPRLIFWNVNSRTQTIPVKTNELGVALVSGFSIAIAKMVMSLELDPYKCLIDILNNERYSPVREILTY